MGQGRLRDWYVLRIDEETIKLLQAADPPAEAAEFDHEVERRKADDR